ncbi:MAG: SIR2 family protein [Nitrospinae bacterium]|nr:SIR2 family protein [Nitrospinota bacterium]
MTLRFSNGGPEFPGELIDSLLAGEVVFLCGTGVSAPQMPDFEKLVERTYKLLAIERTDSEQNAFDLGRFEEVLGSLSRRLANPHAVTRTVSELLAVPDHPRLDQHRTILRLSRDHDNRITVVTTNFDTLLERAAVEVMPNEPPRDFSFAGQALPAPGSSSFSGIIHIHGRLADHEIGLEHTPLVLTSADYGDAYMRSGWASRFLFDLARCKAILLVGYSANDAPVRYFLNVLEADRARFSDLKTVYAFDSYEHNQEEATRSWGTLAVTLLPYCRVNSETGEHDHSPLWRDLAALAEIAERPKRSRRERARRILERPAADANADSRRELRWLFSGRRDLGSVALNAIVDPEWFKVFEDERLWSRDEVWVISSWVAKDWQNRDRLECALEWQGRLGRPFTEKIEQRLRQTEGLDETWIRVWRLFCLAEPMQRDELAYYASKKRLASGLVLDSDLQKAVSLIAPRLNLSRSHRELRAESTSKPIQRLSDIVWPRMTISNLHGAGELVDVLCSMPDRAKAIIDLATAELRSALSLEAELEMIGEVFDENDFTVPSIERHDQNLYREGVNFLVRALTESLSDAAISDRVHTRRVVTGWKSLPGRIGLRLCLHAMRNSILFDADEAMSILLSVSEQDFWSIRREIALLLKERAGTASTELVNKVEERILKSGDAYYDSYLIEPGETDWRAHARDSAVWLRLKMLQDAGILSNVGAIELSAITKRHDHLNRSVEDRDFFGGYISGVRSIVGDPAPIAEALEEDRLQIAHELTGSPDLDLQQGWSAFCRSDPQGAFDSLSKGELTPENGVLWNQFLGGLAFGEEESKTVREDLPIQALEHLHGVDADTLRPMVSGLCDLFYFAPRQRVRDVEGWLVKLWETISNQPEESLDLTANLYERAINSPAGKISRTLLLQIEERKEKGDGPTDTQLRLIKSICDFGGVAGQLGRAILVRSIAFLLSVDRQYVVEVFSPRINATTAEGVALRTVMLRYCPITPEVTQEFRQAIITGVVESESTDHHAATIASNILRPALADLRADNTFRWGLTATDVAKILRKVPQAIRSGTLEVLATWLRNDQSSAETAWRRLGVSFFEKIWPKEREFQDVSLTPHLIKLAVGSGSEFPAALERLRPYISPYDRGYGSLHAITSSEAPEKFPRETLDLVWLVCGPKSKGSFHDVPEIIDRLIKAAPDIETDRRLQGLEQRAERYD